MRTTTATPTAPALTALAPAWHRWRVVFVDALPLVGIVVLLGCMDVSLWAHFAGAGRMLWDALLCQIVLGMLLAAGVAVVEVSLLAGRARLAGFVVAAAGACTASMVMWFSLTARVGEQVWPWWVRFWGNFGSGFAESLAAIALYLLWRRRRQGAAALRDTQRTRLELLRGTAQADLVALQARMDPAHLFETLQEIERAYDAAPIAGQRMIEALIEYLRAALPDADGTTSTVGKECDIARAWLELARERYALDLAVHIDMPPPLRAAPFPPMLVLPLLEDVLGTLRARKHGRVAMTTQVTDAATILTLNVGPACQPTPETLALVRERLARICGDGASVAFRESRIRLEVPHANATRADR